jgi:hypothetical protein
MGYLIYDEMKTIDLQRRQLGHIFSAAARNSSPDTSLLRNPWSMVHRMLGLYVMSMVFQ